MVMLEEQLVHSFLALNYSEVNFFKRSLSITKSLVHCYGDRKYIDELKMIEIYCAGLLQTKNGRKFVVSYNVLEQAYLKNIVLPLDTPIEFELTSPENITHTYEVSLADIVNYLYLLHDKLLIIILEIAKDHGISLGDVTQVSSKSNGIQGAPITMKSPNPRDSTNTITTDGALPEL